MKDVIISIQPKWCELISNDVKTIEVRKTRPKIETPFKCYIYCTDGDGTLTDTLVSWDNRYVLNQKVIGEFICDRIDKYEYYNELPYDKYNLPKSVLKNMCLICHDVDKYGAGKPLYGWHISDLKIYDTPKELGEFRNIKGEQIKRPSQSWCYVEEL